MAKINYKGAQKRKVTEYDTPSDLGSLSLRWQSHMINEVSPEQ